MPRTNLRIAVFAVLASAFVSASASSAPTRSVLKTGSTTSSTAKNQSRTSPSTANANGHTAAIEALHQAHTLVAGANHDYDGHRAKAEHMISQALHELGHQHRASGSNTMGQKGSVTTATGKKGASTTGIKGVVGQGQANKEPQAQSDEQLQKAIQLLSGLKSQLPTTHKAAAHVQSAIGELNAALKIR